ncbi:MAG: hypothetical protein ACPGPE_12410 [Planctomycetota bacterium]
MTKKTKVTQREVWLLALLPAALVLIVSMSIPGPGDEREQVEQRLEKAQSADARSRRQARREKLEGELAETRAELERVQLEQAERRSHLEELQRPADLEVEGPAEERSFVESLDLMSQRLQAHGVVVTGMQSEGTGRGAGGVVMDVSAEAPWRAMGAALADVDVFPPGLGMRGIEMESVLPGTLTRTWTLKVAEVDRP